MRIHIVVNVQEEQGLPWGNSWEIPTKSHVLSPIETYIIVKWVDNVKFLVLLAVKDCVEIWW